MSREIKFRAKRLDNGEWVYGSYIAPEHSRQGAAYIKRSVDDELLTLVDVDPKTKGELLPVRSIDGTEVYEGDVVDYPDSTALRSVVVWSDEECAFQLDLAHREYGRGWAKARMVQLMQVVGDIHTGAGKLES